MDDFQGALSSKTVWAGIVTVAASLLGLGHYTLTPADQASLVNAIVDTVSAVGGVVTIVGRVVASKKIQGVL